MGQSSGVPAEDNRGSETTPGTPVQSAGGRVAGLTVVVPTRNERDNVVVLLDRLDKVCPDVALDVLFVDDSSDGTAEVIRQRAASSARVVDVIHRPPGDRPGGLGGAVHAGLIQARSDWACVMDADLQHPPEVIEAMVKRARGSTADIVIASRDGDTGDRGALSAPRRMLSRSCTLLAQLLFPGRLRGVSDPMSGFFLVRRDAIDLEAMSPRGFKVLLEILVCGAPLRATEVEFRFGTRHAGTSKASVGEGACYIKRLIELRRRTRASRRRHAMPPGAYPSPLSELSNR